MSVTPIQQRLLDCLHQDPNRLDRGAFAAMGEWEWRELFDAARAHRVRPLVYQRLLASDLRTAVPPGSWRSFERDRRRAVKLALRQQAAVSHIVVALSGEGIPALVLKGAHLRETIYRSPLLREMIDIDVLVPRERLGRAAEILCARGYGPSAPFSVELDATLRHDLKTLVGDGGLVELHWNITTPGRPHTIDPEALFHRAVPFKVQGVTALGLSPEDLILYLCAHASYQHQFAFGLRPFCDLAETIGRHGHTLDWRTMRQRAADWHWAPGVYVALALARELVGAGISSEHIESLKPDGLAEDILGVARDQAFTTGADVLALGNQISRLVDSGSGWTRLAHVWRRVFLPRRELASHFGAPVDSSRIAVVMLHGRRLVQLLTHRGPLVVRLLSRRDGELQAVARRKNRLARWFM